MSSYIHFTEEQKQRAAAVDLEEFLRCRGEKLLSSGREKRLASDHSVTVRGNEWYDHAEERGGHAVSFVQRFYGLSYPDAVTMLLGGELGTAYPSAGERTEEPVKPFALPPANKDMRRVFAYLIKHRSIARDVVAHFAKAGLLYEDAEYHNAVFVGTDVEGVPRHAHKRSANSYGKAFRLNVEGSDPRYSFHYVGTDRSLYVFEAPIDMLSFITLYPENWQRHSYVAQLEKNYGKEGSEIIQDNCQDTIFGGFAPNSQTAEVLSKALGNRTVLSGSVSRGKNDPSQSLQMMERPLLTPDELKSIPKGNFIVQKTGQHPMRTRLRLFLEWGITFEKPYIVSERADRAVAYANREDLERNLPQSNKAENADMRGAYAVSGRGGIAHEPAVDKPRRRGGKQMKTYGEEDL